MFAVLYDGGVSPPAGISPLDLPEGLSAGVLKRWLVPAKISPASSLLSAFPLFTLCITVVYQRYIEGEVMVAVGRRVELLVGGCEG